ncbi:MAG: hypothetical protein H0T48_02705 [Gemmatimonadaceae bacterium]|nr:hypothetical protein [Gemmatimonadaceae bacterium]
MQRSKSYAVMFLLGTFLAGGALGFTADRVMSRDKPCRHGSGSRSYLDRMASELKLTPAQRVQFDSIMSRRRTQMRAVYDPIRPQMDSLSKLGKVISDSTHEQLKRVLNPEQQAKLDMMRDRGRKESADARARYGSEKGTPAPRP